MAIAFKQVFHWLQPHLDQAPGSSWADKLDEHTLAWTHVQSNLSRLGVRKIRTPFPGPGSANSRADQHLSAGTRIGNRRLIGLFSNSRVIDEFNDPPVGRAIDLVLDRISGDLDRKGLKSQLPEARIGDRRGTAGGGIGPGFKHLETGMLRQSSKAGAQG